MSLTTSLELIHTTTEEVIWNIQQSELYFEKPADDSPSMKLRRSPMNETGETTLKYR